MGKMKLKDPAPKGTPVWVTKLAHKAGPMLAAQLADGTLIASSLLHKRKADAVARIWQRQWPHLSWQAGKAPKPANLNVFAPHGTPFQRAVWAKTAAIPAGSVLTYQDIARALGRPGAARAVGTALGKNPLVPLVPCHRVVGTRGLIGGYSGVGGLATKRALLKAENVILQD